MNASTKNIYKNARVRSGLKRDPAAEELCVDVRTLDKYESLSGSPPDETVKQMCTLYNDRYLGYQHLKQSPLGEFLPNLTEESFKCATLTMVSNFYSVEDTIKSIIQIAKDGKVNECEREEWRQNTQKMTDLISSLLVVLMAADEQ